MNFLRKIRSFLFGSSTTRLITDSLNDIKGIKKCKFKTIIDNILDYLSDKYNNFIIVPLETINRFCYWGWKLRDSYPFEAGYGIYYFIYLKTKGLIDYSRIQGHLMWNSKEDGKQFRKLKIACQLAQRLSDDNYNTHFREHEKKYGEHDAYFSKCKENSFSTLKHKRHDNMTKKEISKERKLSSIAFNRDRQQEKNEKEYFFKLLERHMTGWWD